MAECKKEKDESDYINNGADGDAESVAEATNEPGVVKGPGQENKLLVSTKEEEIEELTSGVGYISLADNPQPSLIRRGLEPIDVENLLISKVKSLISDKPNKTVIKYIKKPHSCTRKFYRPQRQT